MLQTCEMCGDPFNVRPAKVAAGKGRFCSRPCADRGRLGGWKEGVRYRQTRAPGHPIAPPSGVLATARVILYDAIGAGPHQCHWCEKQIDWLPGLGLKSANSIVVDHLDHDPTNDVVENLVPSCNACNAHRRASGKSPIIQEGELYLVMLDGSRARAEDVPCEHCGKQFLAKLVERAKGKGRFCSMSCARKHAWANR